MSAANSRTHLRSTFSYTLRSWAACATATSRSLTNLTSSTLNSRLNFLRCIDALRLMETPCLGAHQSGSGPGTAKERHGPDHELRCRATLETTLLIECPAVHELPYVIISHRLVSGYRTRGNDLNLWTDLRWHSSKPRRRAPRAWTAIALAVLLSLCFQSLIAAAHHHYDSESGLGLSVQVQGHDGAKAPARPAPRVDDSDTCPICGTLADAAHYLPTPFLTVTLPVLLTATLCSSCALALALSARSHQWQSRAPPQDLRT